MSQVNQAILAGDTERVRLLGEAEGKQFFRFVTEPEGWNYLHIALLGVKSLTPAPMIKYLLQMGVDPNVADYYGNTPLHYAARAKYVEAIELLLDNGAVVDPVNKDGVTPLRQTLLAKPLSLAATSLLLSRGADPDAKIKNGKTVREYVRLISHGADKAIGELFDKFNKTAN